jgi:lipopolysaccharide export system protein LptC
VTTTGQRALVLGGLFAAALATAWLLRQLGEDVVPAGEDYRDPDYYMEDFTTVTMEDDGSPKSRLHAVYMAHYPIDDTTELLKPTMEIYRAERPPLNVSADKGWVTADNEVILLRGGVRMWEDDAAGVRTLQVDTSEARILMNDEYAETEMPTTIVSRRSTITGTGMRAYFKDSRLVVLDHDRTTIAQSPDG